MHWLISEPPQKRAQLAAGKLSECHPQSSCKWRRTCHDMVVNSLV